MLSRTAYRHPDGNASIERMYHTLKEEAIRTNEFDTYDQALKAITTWMDDYNNDRAHASCFTRRTNPCRGTSRSSTP